MQKTTPQIKPNDTDREYNLSDFDFELPDDLIAQEPVDRRDESRLFVLDRKSGEENHTLFAKIRDFLKKGDLLVFNNARVIQARIFCVKESGGACEIILTRRMNTHNWIVISNRTKRLKAGEIIYAREDPSISFKIINKDGQFIEIQSSVPLEDEILNKIGVMPLPPYIKREQIETDILRYQTVYATKSGAVAAPTAGLHFTDELIEDLRKRGVETEFCTLFVSWGTFQPVRTDKLDEHRMHVESYELSEKTAASINQARKEGRRVIAVGTTSLRVLESTFIDGKNVPGRGDTSLFIYPPYRIKSIDGLISNFHTPRSTLLMLVSAFAGYSRIMTAYRRAVDLGYRFFSYGDAMLIL